MLKNISIGAIVLLIMVGIIADSLPGDGTTTVADLQANNAVSQESASFGQAGSSSAKSSGSVTPRKPEGVVKILTAQEVAERAAAGRPVLPAVPTLTDPGFGKPMADATPIIPPTQIGTTRLVDGEIPSDSVQN